jgi:hypothetical protein
MIDRMDISGQGFINVFLKPSWLAKECAFLLFRPLARQLLTSVSGCRTLRTFSRRGHRGGCWWTTRRQTCRRNCTLATCAPSSSARLSRASSPPAATRSSESGALLPPRLLSTR